MSNILYVYKCYASKMVYMSTKEFIIHARNHEEAEAKAWKRMEEGIEFTSDAEGEVDMIVECLSKENERGVR